MRDLVSVVPDFPTPGVNFLEISPLLADRDCFAEVVGLMSRIVAELDSDYILCPESRGYIFGSPIASFLNLGLVIARKPGKLPSASLVTASYQKEYGTDSLCMKHLPQYYMKRFTVVDDIFASGGTDLACQKLIDQVCGIYVGTVVFINIVDLHKRTDVFSLQERNSSGALIKQYY